MNDIRAGQASAPRPATTLESLISEINERLRSISDRQQVVTSGLLRLINPRPVNAVSDQIEKAVREPNTHEDQLQFIIRRLDQIAAAEVDQADTLNSAV